MTDAGIGTKQRGGDARPAPIPAASIDVAYDPRVNFALQQNSVPFVKRVVVKNLGDDDLVDVVVSITTSPAVAERTELRIDRIAAGVSHEVSPVDVRLRPEVLVAQLEREAGTLVVRVTTGDTIVVERTFAFEVLAYDEWNGTASLPEIVAAFVLPNHPEVARILGAARDLLGRQTGNPALEGYQARDPNRALRIVEAVYDAVRGLGLTYASPPASFESNGQKVRTPDRIVESRMATCLDLALLFAACLEQAGLHPLVVMSQGHAFVGAWLVEESFPETATTEPYRIIKRVQLDAIRVFETTGVASRPQIPFADAVREGLRRLEDVDHFLFSVDVASARRSRIRPIPMRGAPGAIAIVTEIRAVADGAGDAPLHPPSSPDAAAPSESAESAPAGRLERWKRKLLDLSLRNRLINYRDTKQTVPLLFPDLARIEDALAAGRRLEVVPKPTLMQGADPRDAALHRGRTGEDGLKPFVADELNAGRLYSRLEPGELGVRLLEMSRGARLDQEAAFGTADAPGAPETEASVARAVASHAGALRAWSGYQLAREEACALGLTPLVAGLESGAVADERLAASFERSFLAWWVRCAFTEEPLLADFSSTLHGLTIERFRELEAEILAATVGVLRARLAAALPRNDSTVSSKSRGEMGTLKREREKKSRHMPLRRLFGEIPNALARLKPCMLMSPLSVAQYLAPDFPRFDLVVFDEASQIPVWDAIGAVARGEKLVVVGDSKQLPPTSFFEKEDAEEDLDEDDVEDLESILNECVAAGLPERTLDWHYRSKHESLIAFSNRKYYGGRLLTFPSAESTVERLGVSLRPVPDGVYDKGHSRSNRREAEELVADLVRRLRDPVESHRSIGVVTFSMAQQTLVENLLEEERRRRPEIEPYFASDRREPVFVKNLENVQGDERDVILFSVCYGPDAQRRVYMNFGPLNRTGGERRLNVAITRAREQVVVFSTLRADQIDLARTRAVGVRDLKAFLEYAERGPSALGDAESGPTGAESESPFEEDVEKALVERGWTVHRQVGCSGYRIDLAVVEPDRPGRYLLGIECDGATYHSGRTARDRDRLRESVLRSLGWRLHRVWSTDWWYEPAREIAKIEASIADARRAATAVGPAASPPPAQVSEPARTSFASSATAPTLVDTPTTAPSVPTYPGPLTGPLRGRPELFFERRLDMQVAVTLREVVDVEAPILVDLAVRRVAALWGVPRVTARTADRVTGLVTWSGVRLAQVHGEALLWRADQNPVEFAIFRRPRHLGAPDRAAEHVPFVELVHAVRFVLEAQLSAPTEDVARETARLFGIARLGSDVRARMERAIEVAAAQGICVIVNGTATLR